MLTAARTWPKRGRYGCRPNTIPELPLPIAGLMSDQPIEQVEIKWKRCSGRLINSVRRYTIHLWP
jgi:hypothetical protein